MRKALVRLLFAAATLAAGFAHAFTLSGTVFGGGSPLPNATVTLFDAGTSAQLQQTTTNGSGQYSFIVNAGTYNLQVAPQAPSQYAPASVNGVVVSAGNITQDILLFPPSHLLSGHVRTAGGQAMGGFQVTANAGGVNVDGMTDVNGAYSISVSAGTYTLLVFKPGPITIGGTTPAAFPAYFSYGIPNVIVSADTTQDASIPLVLLSGKTTDANAVAVAGVTVSTSLPGGTVPCGSSTCSWTLDFSVTSDASGNYSILLIPGTYTLRLTPPLSAPNVGQTSTSVVVGTVDTTRDLQLPSIFVLSGHVRTAGGQAMGGFRVTANAGGVNVDGMTDVNGAYSISVSAGTYTLLVFKPGPITIGGTTPAAFPAYFSYGIPNVIVSADTTQDASIPLVLLSGKTTDANAVAVAGVTVSTSLPGGTVPCGSSTCSWTLDFSVTSDASGNYSILLIPGTYTLRLTPPLSAPNVGQTSTSVVVGTVDTTRDLQLPSIFVVSGHVRTAGGQAMGGFRVTANAGGVNVDGMTDVNGAYSISVSAGTYTLLVFKPGPITIGGTTPAAFPAYFSYGIPNVIVSADTTQDASIPLVLLSGKTTDANAVAVAGVTVSTSLPGGTVPCGSSTCSWTLDFSVTSDASGNYSMLLIPGTYTLHLTPPPGSGFGASQLSGFSIAGDQFLNVILPFPDTGAPLILSGPFVRELTSSRALVEWLTNEPTSGSVTIAGAGTFTEPGTARTNHSVLLTGLAASTAYVAQVSSTDTSGNGPVTASAPFTTKPAPDTTPPVFVDGPIVTAITHQDAVVEWKSDEAASGVVDYGPTVAFGSSVSEGTAKVRQRLSLSGLSASTTYQVRASATDAAGNGPTQSATLSFKTLAAPDVDPPKIIGKPMALEVTANAATIAWVTDKPATSGVSWNDGTAYGLVTDTAFVTAHTVRITGLVSGSPYTVTASSKDEKDNGPTLSAISFNTLPAGDVLPPVITAGPQVLNLTRKTAAISWRTSEPSDARVFYGTSATALTEQEAKAKLETKHLLTLTKLTPGATYYYRVESRDVAGNASAPTAVQSFTTPTASSAAMVFEQVPVLKSKSDKSLTVEWQTSAPGDAQLECDPVGGGETKRVAKAERDTKQQLTISNLQPNVAYNCRAKSIDIDGNGVEQ